MISNILKIQIIILFILQFIQLPAQGDKEKFLISQNGDTVYIKAIPLSEITNIESAYDKVKKIEEQLVPSKDMIKFDSLYRYALNSLDSLKTIILSKKELSLKQIDDHLMKWSNYSNILNTWKIKINDRIKLMENDQFDVNVLLETWKMTLSGAKESGVPDNVLTSVTDIIKKIEKIDIQVKSAKTEALRKQNKITELRIIVDEVTNYLVDNRKKLQADYFRADSRPIWAIGDSKTQNSSISIQVNESIERNKGYLNNFYQTNSTNLLIQLLLFIALWVGFYYLHKQAKELAKQEDSAIPEKAIYVVSKHTLSALVISLFLSIWLYQSLVSVVGDTIQFAFLIIAFLFLPGYIDKRIKIILYTVILLFILNQIQLLFEGTTTLSRLTLFAESVLAAWILYKLTSRSYCIRQILEKDNWSVLLKLVPIFYVLLVVSVIANIFGLVNLSLLLNNTLVNALLNIVILVMIIMVLNRSISILLRTNYFQKSNIIKKNLVNIEKRTFTTIQVLGLLLWIRSVLNLLGLLPALNTWFSEAIQTSWKIGNMTIEVGGIVSFILVILTTIFITRVLKIFLKDEIYPRVKLPRGVPGAISMITGYVIVAYGFFVALGAAGVDLGQFGLIAGALGVGIGFGLQGIVANFIAGIVLAFERPIQVGDTIEIGTMMGEVVHIGVRSSTVRTFEGSEVIIPNSSLITNDVTNWTLSDRKKRRDIFVGVAYGSDPQMVMQLMTDIAGQHPEVQHIPAPWATFDGFGDNSLNFRLRIWTTMDTGLGTKSEVTVSIYDALNKAGIQIPFPQRDLYIKTMPDFSKTKSTVINKKRTTKNKKTDSEKDEPII